MKTWISETWWLTKVIFRTSSEFFKTFAYLCRFKCPFVYFRGLGLVLVGVLTLGPDSELQYNQEMFISNFDVSSCEIVCLRKWELISFLFILHLLQEGLLTSHLLVVFSYTAQECCHYHCHYPQMCHSGSKDFAGQTSWCDYGVFQMLKPKPYCCTQRTK